MRKLGYRTRDEIEQERQELGTLRDREERGLNENRQRGLNGKQTTRRRRPSAAKSAEVSRCRRRGRAPCDAINPKSAASDRMNFSVQNNSLSRSVVVRQGFPKLAISQAPFETVLFSAAPLLLILFFRASVPQKLLTVRSSTFPVFPHS